MRQACYFDPLFPPYCSAPSPPWPLFTSPAGDKGGTYLGFYMQEVEIEWCAGLRERSINGCGTRAAIYFDRDVWVYDTKKLQLKAYGPNIRRGILVSEMDSTGTVIAEILWQDAENRVYLGKELDRITGQGKSAISVDDTLKIIGCREQQKKLTALEMELAAARQEGFMSKHLSTTKTPPEKRPLVVIGVLTGFGRKNNREVIRKAWMSTGEALKKTEDQKGVIVRFVIGRRYTALFQLGDELMATYFNCSANRGDSLDRGIDIENKNYNDFFVLESHLEAPKELPKKTKLFFAHAAERWEVEYYAKVNDDVYVNIGKSSALG